MLTSRARSGVFGGWRGMRSCVFSELLGSFVKNHFFVVLRGSMLGESAESGVVLALVTALEPGEDVQSAGVIAQRSEGAGEQRQRGFVMIRCQAPDFTIEHGRLKFAEAGLAPVCGGHHSDQGALDGRSGREIALEDGELGSEVVLGCGVGE